ncbi:MAG: Hpt domain-containing protein, partial [Arenimonas sp.]
VWSKPIEMGTLQNHVARILDLGAIYVGATSETKLWDEAAALLAVGGNQATLIALRKMFLAELPMHTEIIERAFRNTDLPTLKNECHKLLAGCGFVGARNLSVAVRQLSENPDKAEDLQAMLLEVEKCISAIA